MNSLFLMKPINNILILLSGSTGRGTKRIITLLSQLLLKQTPLQLKVLLAWRRKSILKSQNKCRILGKRHSKIMMILVMEMIISQSDHISLIVAKTYTRKKKDAVRPERRSMNSQTKMNGILKASFDANLSHSHYSNTTTTIGNNLVISI